MKIIEIQTGHLISTRKPDLVSIKKKKKDLASNGFGRSRVKIKESENIDKYLNLAREQKKLWNMRVTVIPIVVCALGTVRKGLEVK